MLRESFRLLKTGGVLAGYIIHTPEGLTEDQIERAIELGPPSVGAAASPQALARQVGFSSVDQHDVTDRFKKSCLAFKAARTQLEGKLRELEGDEVYDENCEEGKGRLLGIEEGLLLRCLLVAVRP